MDLLHNLRLHMIVKLCKNYFITDIIYVFLVKLIACVLTHEYMYNKKDKKESSEIENKILIVNLHH